MIIGEQDFWHCLSPSPQIYNNLRQAIKSALPLSSSPPDGLPQQPTTNNNNNTNHHQSASSSPFYSFQNLKFPKLNFHVGSSSPGNHLPQYLRNALNTVHTRLSSAASQASPGLNHLVQRSRSAVTNLARRLARNFSGTNTMPPHDDTHTSGLCGCLAGLIRGSGSDNGPVEIMVVGSAGGPKLNGNCAVSNGTGGGGSNSCLVVTTPPDEINREDLEMKFAELVVRIWLLILKKKTPHFFVFHDADLDKKPIVSTSLHIWERTKRWHGYEKRITTIAFQGHA